MTAGISKLDIDMPNRDTDCICENQTTGGAANLSLNGAHCDLGTAGQFDIGDAYGSGVGGILLDFDSAGDISGVTFTITGKDQDGNSQTEDVTGVTTTAVRTTKYWSQVTQIAADGAVGSNVFVGSVAGEMATPTIPVNRYSDDAPALAISGYTGTITFSVQETYDEIRTAAQLQSAAWVDILTDQTANVNTSANANASAVRVIVTTHNDDGPEFQFHVSYNPVR